jgi:hypothetical protein
MQLQTHNMVAAVQKLGETTSQDEIKQAADTSTLT